jgi:hypothetical protein
MRCIGRLCITGRTVDSTAPGLNLLLQTPSDRERDQLPTSGRNDQSRVEVRNTFSLRFQLYCIYAGDLRRCGLSQIYYLFTLRSLVMLRPPPPPDKRLHITNEESLPWRWIRPPSPLSFCQLISRADLLDWPQIAKCGPVSVTISFQLSYTSNSHW